MRDTPPEQLSERELFTEYVELLKQREISGDAYEEVTLHKRQACLLAEIGERLEALEAAKALLEDTNTNNEPSQYQADGERQFSDPHRLSFDDE
jgi:hypothetical protein